MIFKSPRLAIGLIINLVRKALRQFHAILHASVSDKHLRHAACTQIKPRRSASHKSSHIAVNIIMRRHPSLRHASLPTALHTSAHFSIVENQMWGCRVDVSSRSKRHRDGDGDSGGGDGGGGGGGCGDGGKEGAPWPDTERGRERHQSVSVLQSSVPCQSVSELELVHHHHQQPTLWTLLLLLHGLRALHPSHTRQREREREAACECVCGLVVFRAPFVFHPSCLLRAHLAIGT